MAEKPGESVLAYIGYATVGDVWSEAKVALLIFALFGGFAVVLAVGLDWITGAVVSTTGSASLGLPKWLGSSAVFCGALWLLRGKTISLPNLNFKEWLFITVLILASAFLDGVLPSWGVALWYGVLMAGLYIVETLNECGKKNYERLNASTDIASTDFESTDLD